MIINAQSIRALDKSFSTAFQKAFDETKTTWQDIATTVPSATDGNNYQWLGQFPQMREWIGEREIQNLSAYDYYIKNKHFEMSYGINRDAIEDDQYGVYTPLYSNIGQSAALHPETLVYGAAKDGFTKLCYDKKTFFSDEHNSGGKTFSNLSHLKLTTAAYEAARASMMLVTGDKGKPLGVVPDTLVVSPQNEHIGRLILEADQIEGTTNVNKGTAKLIISPELADKPDAWFLLCTSRVVKPFIYQERKKIQFVSRTKNEDDNVFDRNEYIWGADGRSNVGYGFWQMAYGSDGTTQTQG